MITPIIIGIGILLLIELARLLASRKSTHP